MRTRSGDAAVSPLPTVDRGCGVMCIAALYARRRMRSHNMGEGGFEEWFRGRSVIPLCHVAGGPRRALGWKGRADAGGGRVLD
jgi:hypothetical protein